MALEKTRAVPRLLMPMTATVSLRLSQFLVLLILARLSESNVRPFMISAFGILTAFTILSDAGAANYMLANTEQLLGRRVYRLAIAMQLGLGLLGTSAALALCAWRAPVAVDPAAWSVTIALGVAQLLDGALRAVRVPMLLRGDDVRYSLPELGLALLKLPILSLAYLVGDLQLLIILPLVSASVLLPTGRRMFVSLQDEAPPAPRTGRRILQYGLAGSMSGLYSQLPLVIAAATLPLNSTAMLTVAYRVTQPLELVPGTLATQLLPRVRVTVKKPWRWWLSFCGTGTVLFLLAWAASDVLRQLFMVPVWNSWIFVLVAVALVPKAGNYALAAMVMGLGGIRGRLIVTAIVGAISIVVLTILANEGRVLGIAAMAPLSEVFLAIGLGLCLRRLKVRKVD